MEKVFRQIYVEISNLCNLNCPFCIHSKRNNTIMSKEDFQKVLVEIAPYTKSVYLHILGEPLIHPDFENILEAAKAHGVDVKITTNGVNLDKYGDIIINSGIVKRVNISLQALTSLSETSIRSYLNNLKTFLINASMMETLNVSVRMWGNFESKNQKVMEIIKTFFEKEFDFNTLSSGKMIIPHIYFSKEYEFVWPSLENEDNKIKTSCLGGKTHIGILADGDVVMCCLDSNGDTTFGNIFKEPFSQIIKNEKYIKAVENFKKKEATFALCKKCTYRNKFLKNDEEVLK